MAIINNNTDNVGRICMAECGGGMMIHELCIPLPIEG